MHLTRMWSSDIPAAGTDVAAGQQHPPQRVSFLVSPQLVSKVVKSFARVSCPSAL